MMEIIIPLFAGRSLKLAMLKLLVNIVGQYCAQICAQFVMFLNIIQRYGLS